MKLRIAHLFDGPHLRLPRPVDAVGEWWAARRPRTRMAVGIVVVLAAVAFVAARARAADARWGGEPVTVYVAERDHAVGDVATELKRARFPPAVVPPEAVTQLPQQPVLAFALPAGSVLTRRHLDPVGPAAGLDADLQAVPLPAEPGWGLVGGGNVDVWVLGGGERPAARVAIGRPVLHLRTDPQGLTALVGLRSPEVQAVTEGLAVGRVLLTHTAAAQAAGDDTPG